MRRGGEDDDERRVARPERVLLAREWTIRGAAGSPRSVSPRQEMTDPRCRGVTAITQQLNDIVLSRSALGARARNFPSDAATSLGASNVIRSDLPYSRRRRGVVSTNSAVSCTPERARGGSWQLCCVLRAVQSSALGFRQSLQAIARLFRATRTPQSVRLEGGMLQFSFAEA